MSDNALYLASASPRRKELLTQIGYEFEVLRVDVPEVLGDGECPAHYVERLSLDKAQAGVLAATYNRPVIGADTIVVIDGTILEKPENIADARQMLGQLSGQQHQVMTAVTVADKHRTLTRLVTTNVWFKTITDEEIDSYWASGEPQDKAGSYGIQGLGGRFVTRLEGSYFAVVGLPLYETEQLLQEFCALR